MKTKLPDDAVLLAAFKEGASRPLHVAELASHLEVPVTARRALTDALDALVDRGLLARLPGSRYRLPKEKGSRLEGRFVQHPRGFGFVSVADGGQDVYVPATSILGAMHGDVVLVTAHEGARGREGVVLDVLTRRPPRVPGVLRIRPKGTWVEPDDARIRGPIPVKEHGTGKDGEAVVCEITRWPEHPGEVPEGLVRETLGPPGDLDVEVLKVLIREGVEEGFPEPVAREVDRLPDHVTDADRAGREDLRALPLLTIDPEDARDHDDAVHVESDPEGGWVATVAIADVSHYVREGSALDASALGRGTSIYLPDRAIPMLPHQLSSHLASLIEGQDRLSLGVQVSLAPDGEVRSARLFEAVVRSHAYLTYPQVARALGWSAEGPEAGRAEDFLESLKSAADLATVLRRKRLRRGALDLDLPEAKVRFADDEKTPVDIVQSRQDPGVRRAYQLVEELMLLANEVIATTCLEHEAPAIYRVHGEPDEEALSKLATVARAYGHKVDLEAGRVPRKLADLLKKVHGKPEARIISMLVLRSMQQARYSAENTGHFGLASQAYLHFTSPIRRYPDLVVHRAVRAILQERAWERGEEATAALAAAAAAASRRERGAMELEREVMDLYRCVVARGRVGEVHEGTVTGVTNAGPYVDLDAPFVSGLLRVEQFGDDNWELDELGIQMVSERSGLRFALGDRVVVELAEVSIPRRTIYLKLVGEEREVRPSRKPVRKGKPEKAERGRRKK